MKQRKHRPITTKGIVVTSDPTLLVPCESCGVIRREHDSEIPHPYKAQQAYPVDHAFTPGPWQQAITPRIEGIFDGASGWLNVMHHSGIQIETEDGAPIALVAPTPTDTGLRPAALNADLIAAAPDLLSALYGILGALPKGERWPVYLSDAILAARAAVNKAHLLDG